jgi:hypothetical protein
MRERERCAVLNEPESRTLTLAAGPKHARMWKGTARAGAEYS